MAAGQEMEISEGQIAVHWREENYYPAPAKFIGQANATDPAIFERFSELGSARAVWLWLRSEDLKMPVQRSGDAELAWIEPTYAAVHRVLTHPSYAGAYVHGRTRRERRVDDDGRIRQRARQLRRGMQLMPASRRRPGPSVAAVVGGTARGPARYRYARSASARIWGWLHASARSA